MLKQFYNIFTAWVLNQVGIKNWGINIIDYAENEIPKGKGVICVGAN